MYRSVISGLGTGAVLLGVGCATAIKDTGDSGGSCAASCVGELSLEAADGRDDFGLSIYGEDFPTLQVGCPDGITAGGPPAASVACVSGGVRVTLEGVSFPDPLYLTASIGTDFTAEQSFSLADFQLDEVCGTTCNTGALVFELPETTR